MKGGLPHLADAVAHPGAVVVELAHAVVAHGAVRAARRAVVVARHAPLGVDCVSVHLVLLGWRALPGSIQISVLKTDFLAHAANQCPALSAQYGGWPRWLAERKLKATYPSSMSSGWSRGMKPGSMKAVVNKKPRQSTANTIAKATTTHENSLARSGATRPKKTPVYHHEQIDSP